MMYALILNTRGTEEVVEVGELEYIRERENALRKECRKSDPDGVEIDCYVMSELQARRNEQTKKFWETLTDEDKKDIIEIDGRKYIRKVYEMRHKN